MILPRFLIGLLAGLLLCGKFEVSGADLFQVPAADYQHGAVLRAGGLVLFALIFASGRRWMGSRAGTDLMLGTLLGFWMRGAFLHGSIARSLTLVIVALLAVLVFSLTRRGASLPGRPLKTTWHLPLLGLTATGVAVAVEALARQTLRLGAGEPSDSWAMGGIALATALLGGVAFGRFLRTGEVDRAGTRAIFLGLAGAGLGCVAGLWILARIGSTQGLDAFLRRFGLDSSEHGTWLVDGLIALQVSVVPMFLLGTAFYCAARQRAELSALLLGLSLAPLWIVRRLELPADANWIPAELPVSAHLVVEGALAAGAVALLAQTALPGSLMQRLFGALVPLAALATGLLPVEPLPITRPWDRNPLVPETVFEIPEGQLTVYPNAVYLDHAQLTPDEVGREGDRAQIRSALAQAPSSEGVRVLWIGQLDPGRAETLSAGGAVRVDRSASWWRAMEFLEARLFAGAPRPEGNVLSPAQASRRLAAQEYDLVIVPAVPGAWTRLPDFSFAPGTRGVIWQAAGGSLVDQELEPVLLTAGMLEELWIGTAVGEWGAEVELETYPMASAPWVVPAWERLARPSAQRRPRDRATAAQRLARGAPDGPPSDWARGLALHFGVQRPSSPFDRYPATLELDRQALELWANHAQAGLAGSFEREVWSALAFALVGKRDVAAIRRYLDPLVERDGWQAWPALDRALAYADREAMQPERALERLTRLRAVLPEDLTLLQDLAQALGQAGRHEESATHWQELLVRDPMRHQAVRELAVQLLRSGNPDGRPVAEGWLGRHPDDEELLQLLEMGPVPVAEPGFTPEAPPHDHGDG